MNRAFLYAALLLLANIAGAVASTPIPPSAKIFSDAEAQTVQQELVSLPPEELLQKLRSVPARDSAVRASGLPGELLPGDRPNEPPLWLGIYTAPVMAEAFRLLDARRAAQLLPVLWELRDPVLPEQTVLFAAACFAALPDRGSHAAFAARLDSELNALMRSPLPQNDRDTGNTAMFRRRALDALAMLWEGTPAEQKWVVDQCTDPELDDSVRTHLLDHLTDILLPIQAHQADLSGDFSGYQKLKIQQWQPQWDKLRAKWGGKDWVHELLIPLAESPTQPASVRSGVMYELSRLLGQDAELRTLQMALLQSEGNHSSLRQAALFGLEKTVGPEEDLKRRLIRIVESPEESGRLRKYAIGTLGRHWKDDPGVHETLAVLVESADDHVPVQKAALRALPTMGDKVRAGLDQRLTRIAGQASLPWPLRKDALEVLGNRRGQDASTTVTIKHLLIRMALNSQEKQELRLSSLMMLSGRHHLSEEEKAQIMEILRSPQEPDRIKFAALGALNIRFHEGKNNDWVKELQMALVGPQEKSVALRTSVLWGLPQEWRGAAWVKELYASMLSSPTELEEVRAKMVQATRHGGWAGEVWLKDLLTSFAGRQERHLQVRAAALEILAYHWHDEPWSFDLVKKIASSADEPRVVRLAALQALALNWPGEEEVGQICLSVILSPHEDLSLRTQAVYNAPRIRSIAARMSGLLETMVRSSTEMSELRVTALRSRRWGWGEHAKLLADLLGPEESDAAVREAAFDERAVARENWLTGMIAF